MAKIYKDFDQFLAEREDKTMIITVFGRQCEVPIELPWLYMMKIERFVKSKIPISGEENMALLSQMFKPDDYKYIVEHPEFRASNIWDLIAFAWLNVGDEEKRPEGPVFRTEDDVKIEKTRANSPKKRKSAR